MRSFKRYCVWMIGGVSLGLCVIGGFNWLVDPYDVFARPKTPHFNEIKPAVFSNIRKMKAYQLKEIRPATVLLGSSRVQLGLSTEHPGFKHTPVYNLGFPRATLAEMRRYLEYAYLQGPVKEVIMGLDFFSFNIYLNPIIQDLNQELDPTKAFSTMDHADKRAALWGWGGTQASLKTWWYNYTHHYSPPKLNGVSNISVVSDKSQHQLFVDNERMFIEQHVYRPYPEKKFAFTDEYRGSTFDEFEKILEFCKHHDIELHLFVSPTHARQQLLIHYLGLWPQFEQWRQILVDRLAYWRSPSFPLRILDYGGFHTRNCEIVPRASKMASMTWFIESSHFSKAYGDAILDQLLFGKKGPGIDLTVEDLPKHLLQIRLGRLMYQERFGQDAQEVKELTVGFVPLTQKMPPI